LDGPAIGAAVIVMSDWRIRHHCQVDHVDDWRCVLNRLTQLGVLGHNPFDANCCHMVTAIKHPVLDRVKPSFVIFDIRALWRSALSVRVAECRKLQMTA